MKKILEFKTIAIDTLTFRAGTAIHAGETFTMYSGYDDLDDDDVTKEGEGEILRWLIESNAKDLLLGELNVGSSAFIAQSVKQPIVENPQGKPGDIDLLICDDYQAERAIAIQCKRVKVRALNQTDDDLNKLSDITGGVTQANFQRSNLGFHRNYLMIIMEADGRRRDENNVLFRGPSQETFKAVYEFPRRESLHDDIGVIFVDISQPTGKSFHKMSVVGVCLDKEASRLDQPPRLTNRVKEMMLRH
jgi:hypothetical protein